MMESRQDATGATRDSGPAALGDVQSREENAWRASGALEGLNIESADDAEEGGAYADDGDDADTADDTYADAADAADDDGAGADDALDGDSSWLDGEGESDEQPLGADHLWTGDTGTLPQDARSSLLRLVKGPYISESNDPAYWRALLNHAETIRSRLADLFLELIIDAEAGVAFAKNVTVEGKDFPKAATSYTLTLLDTIMVLLLRKELQTAGGARVFIGQTELFLQMNQYRDISKLDQAAYLKRLETSWSRLEKQRLLVKSDVEGRYEISPVLKLVFGAEEAQAVFDEYEGMRAQLQGHGPDETDIGADAGADGSDGETSAPAATGTLFDGLI